MFCMIKKKRYALFMFQNKIQTVKSKLFFYWFQTEKYAKLGPKGDGII